MWNKSFGNVKNGTSIVETIMAIAMVAIVIPALIVLGVVSLRSSNNAERRSEASKLASSAIEAVKYVRDNDACGLGVFPQLESDDDKAYLKLDPSSGDICNVFSQVSYSNRNVNIIPDTNHPENIYERTITISRYNGSTDTIKVDVIVTWGSGEQGEIVSQSAIINSLTAY